MAVSFNALNRNQEWSSDEKKALRKLFTLAQSAATGGDSTIISPKVVHRTCEFHMNAQDYTDVRALMSGLRDAIDAANTSYDVVQHTTAFRMEASKKKIIKELAEAVVPQIV